jgi:hypothetical protein
LGARTPRCLRAFDFADAGGKLGCQQAVVSGLGRELLNGGKPDVDRRRRETLRFEMTPVLLHNRFLRMADGRPPDTS